jgi:TonB family protein
MEQKAETPAAADGDASKLPFDAPERNIRTQIERNWNLGSLAASPDLAEMMVELRIALLPDGTVTEVQVVNAQPSTAETRQLAESAIRAVMIASPLKLPPGTSFSSITVRFRPSEAVQ